MGLYFDHKDGTTTKEDWLKEHGKQVDLKDFIFEKNTGWVPIVLVQNYAFSGAAIAVTESEFNLFTKSGQDSRQKTYYYVPIDNLLEDSDIADRLEKYKSTFIKKKK